MESFPQMQNWFPESELKSKAVEAHKLIRIRKYSDFRWTRGNNLTNHGYYPVKWSSRYAEGLLDLFDQQTGHRIQSIHSDQEYMS